MKTKSSIRRGWAAALGGVLLAASVAVSTVSTTASAAGFPALYKTTIATGLLNKVAGNTAGVSAMTNDFPAAAGDSISITFAAVKTKAGTAVTAATGVKAVWCANSTTVAGVTTALTGSSINTLTGIQDHCMSYTNVATKLNVATAEPSGDVTVTGTLGSLPPNNFCRTSEENVAAGGGPTVIPCLLVLATTSQTVAIALPLVNLRAGQVAGPLNRLLLAAGTVSVVSECSTPAAPNDSPSRSCPGTWATTLTQQHPVAFGGIGFAYSTNTLDLSDPATWTTGNSTGFVSHGTAGQVAIGLPNGLTLCSDVAGTTCGVGVLNGGASVNAWAGPVPVNLPADPTTALNGVLGKVGGAVAISAAPGDYFLKMDYTYIAPTADLPAGSTALAFSGGALSKIVQSQMIPVRVLASTPSCTLDPIAGGVAATTTVACSGLAPYATGSIKVLDATGFQRGSTITVKSNGIGDAVAEGVSVEYPSTQVTVDFAAGGENVVVLGPPPTDNYASFASGPLAFDSKQVADCQVALDLGTCSVGLITGVTVDPGGVGLSVVDGATDLALNNVDLSTIKLNDPDTWYSVSLPALGPVILAGDFTGDNAGFTVTAGASDMQGATVAGNKIPANDVWVQDQNCDVWGAISGLTVLAGDDTVGTATAGTPEDTTAGEDADTGASLLATSEADICTVIPETTGANAGRAAGVFELQFSVAAAGRVNTAADDYVGLLFITITK